MEDQITPKKIARILGISERAALKRATQESWPAQEIKGRGRGGFIKYFIIERLPANIRNQVIQAQNSDYEKKLILPQRPDLDLEKAKALLQLFDNSPRWNQRKAEARGEIVQSFIQFSKDKKLTTAKGEFVNRFNVHNNHLGISEETFHLFPRICRATLDKYRKKYITSGLAGLLDQINRGKPKGKFTQDIEVFIIGILAKSPHTRPVRIYDYIKNKFSGQSMSLPGKRAVYNWVNKWKKENESVYTFLKNPDKWRSNFQLALGDSSEKAKYFLHILEFDNTPADIMCADKKRYTLAGAIDNFCRKAKILIVPVGKSIAIANLMRRINLDWGFFSVMIKDNGQDYASRHIEAVCGALGIDMPSVPPFTPQAKPHIERFFRTISMMLFEELPGYIGHSVAERKDIEARRSFAQRMFTKGEVIECSLMPEELQGIIDNWIETIYHQRTHSELGKSPEAKAAESTRPVRKITNERLLDILLAPCGHPIVQKKGIRFQNGFYVAPELGDYVKQEVEIRQDLADAGTLYVFEKASKKFICIAKDATLAGLSVEEIIKARKQQRKNIQAQAKALKTLAKEVGNPMLDLLEAKAQEPGRIVSFHREEKAESPMIQEVEKAFEGPSATFEEFKPNPADLKAIEHPKNEQKVVPIHDDPPFFDSMLQRYKYLKEQRNIRKLTQRDEGFIEGYEASEEYFRIFEMPYL